MKFKSLCLILAFGVIASGTPIHADVQIQTFNKKYSWKEEWTQTILNELKKDDYRDGEKAMLNIEIDNEDLAELDCIGYNSSSLDEKSKFWVVFFSALTRSESAFNENARSRMSRGHRSHGLLQLAHGTARSQCSIAPPDRSVNNPHDNLKCGLKLMSWQLAGAPKSSGKKIRPDLEGQIFGKYMFQWGPLRQNDIHGRSLLVNWFKDHVDQLKFCQIKSKSE